jgi:hypothetical protein
MYETLTKAKQGGFATRARPTKNPPRLAATVKNIYYYNLTKNQYL